MQSLTEVDFEEADVELALELVARGLHHEFQKGLVVFDQKGGETHMRPVAGDRRTPARVLLERPRANKMTPDQYAGMKMILGCGSAPAAIVGDGGVGKSYMISCLLEIYTCLMLFVTTWLPERIRQWVALTASTGCASHLIHGRTIHSLLHLPRCCTPTAKNVARVQARGEPWIEVGLLRMVVIDEISMISATQLDFIDALMRRVRQSEEAFGGVKFVFVGDFMQLPPVVPNSVEGGKMAFTSDVWRSHLPSERVVLLTKQMRQLGADSSNTRFVQALRELRFGKLCEASRRLLEETGSKTPTNDHLVMYPTNDSVDKHNRQRLAQLHTQSHIYSAQWVEKADGAESRVAFQDKALCSKISRGALRLELKVGTRVMLTANIDIEAGLFNGAIGRVVAFAEPGDDGDDGVSGTRFLCEHVGYQSEMVDPDALPLFPLVDFGDAGVHLQCPTIHDIPTQGRYPALEYAALPLRLSWALTIHKSQGQTAPQVMVVLEGNTSPTHAYVGCSRVKSLEGLIVRGMPTTFATVSVSASDFYAALLPPAEPEALLAKRAAPDAIPAVRPEDLSLLADLPPRTLTLLRHCLRTHALGASP